MVPPSSGPPGDVGYMPEDAPLICVEKRDAVQRWIEAGAPAS